MVFDESNVYAFFAQNVGNNINPRTYYTLYAASKDATAVKNQIPYIWRLDRPGLLANAMVLAGRNLFLAGPPDVADEEKTYDFVFGADDEINRQMRRQEQAWLGKEGALLWVVSADTGQRLSEYELPAIPVWDGMIAANGRLYLSLKDETVLCIGPYRR